MIGRTISHYKILSKLGEGGMGVVYKAEDTKLERPVALKFLPSNSLGDEEAQARFLREARAAAALQHPNICTIHEIDEVDGHTFIVMAYLEGEELRKHIEKGPLSLDRLLDIAIQVARGLEEAHSKGVVHRDIKPANIMDTTTGQAVLMDFGLAQIASAASKLTREGTTVGTSAYMSPEQTTGEKTDHRTDIWALGVVLYEMATGQAPFQGHYEQAILYSILHEAPDPITALRTGLPPELERIANKCLTKRADERYQTVSDLLADLGALKRSRESSEGKRQSSVTRDARPSIAVLPFQNRSRGEDDEYFSDGVTEDIISTLGNIEGLRVIPRASAFHFKGKRPSLSEVVGLLKVSHILEGSVRRAGDRLRITVELIDSAEGEQLWTQRYDRVMEDIFDVQDEISRAVADALKVRLLGDAGTRLARRGTTDVEAYNLVLKGRHLANQYRRESLEQSLKCFEEAIRLDPKFAAAHADAGETYAISAAVAGGPPHELMPKVKQAASRALALDEEAPEGHLVMAMYLLCYEWNWAAAEREFRRAIELNPNDSAARRYLGEFLCWWRPSRVTEAREMLEKGVANDPLYLNGSRCLVIAYVVEGNHKAALATCNTVLSLSPDFHPIYYQIGITLAAQGRMPEAIAAFEKGLSIGAGDQILEAALGMACALGDREEKALELIETFKGRRENGYASASSIGCIYAALQDFDQAFEWFEKAVEERDILLTIVTWVKPWKGFERLVADPRFKQMVQTIGMEL